MCLAATHPRESSYRVEADSGNGLRRSFCSKRRTRILVQPEGMESIAVSYTSLDDIIARVTFAVSA